MGIEIIQPQSRDHWLELRSKDVTSTTVSALFGLCPYVSKFELWHRLHDSLPPEEISGDRIMWGELLQGAIAKGVAQERGWKIREMKEYIRTPELRLGASFDYSIEESDEGKDGLLEIKNVDGMIFRDQWVQGDGAPIEAPPHIEIQIQAQMLVSQRSWGYITPLVGGNDVKYIRRERDEKICQAIRDNLGAFWASIEEHKEPEPDFNTDAGFVAKLYGTTPDKAMDATGNADLLAMVQAYDVARSREKIFAQEKEAAKAAILYMIKDHEKVYAPEYTIKRSLVKGGERHYVTQDHRTTSIRMKGKK